METCRWKCIKNVWWVCWKIVNLLLSENEIGMRSVWDRVVKFETFKESSKAFGLSNIFFQLPYEIKDNSTDFTTETQIKIFTEYWKKKISINFLFHENIFVGKFFLLKIMKFFQDLAHKWTNFMNQNYCKRRGRKKSFKTIQSFPYSLSGYVDVQEINKNGTSTRKFLFSSNTKRLNIKIDRTFYY